MKTRMEIIVETERWIIVRRQTGFQDYQDSQDNPVNPVNPENLENPVSLLPDKDVTQYHSYFSRSHRSKQS